MAWWIWIILALVLLFNMLRRYDQEKRLGRKRPQLLEDETEGEEMVREERLSDLLQTLRAAVAPHTPPPAPKKPLPVAGLPGRRSPPTPVPPYSPPSEAGAPARPAAALEARPAPEEELRESLSFSNEPLLQGIIFSEVLGAPVGERQIDR